MGDPGNEDVDADADALDETLQPPIDGNVLLHAGALASVGPGRLPDLCRRAQEYLAAELPQYRRRFECIHENDRLVAFLVPSDHWEEVAEAIPMGSRAADAVRRAHEQQFRRLGSDLGRRDEFETALEIRSAVLVGRGGSDGEN